jgi:hypothetical protein
MKKKPIRICIDRIVPEHAAPGRTMMERALREIDPGAISPHVRMAMPILKKWPIGTEINCRFLDGSQIQKKKVEDKAHIWEQYANIKFKFIDTGPAEVRISFLADPGSWSAVGTDALNSTYFPLHEPTMNYGWLKDDTDDAEYNRVVLHEFGHALGAIHEHQSPGATLKWNTDEVYRVFSGPPNFWSREDIDHNVLEKYSRDQMNWTAFDIKSIMLYGFPGSLFEDGKETPSNTDLSDKDKEFMGAMYPT